MTGDDVFDLTQNSFFALLLKPVLKLIVGIKMILDRLFAASCDQYDFSDALEGNEALPLLPQLPLARLQFPLEAQSTHAACARESAR